MKLGTTLKTVGLVAILGLTMSACGSGNNATPTTTTTTAVPTSSAPVAPPSTATSTTAAPTTTSAAPGGIDCGTAATALTMSGWSLSTTPEFQKLVDGFKTVCPQITITIKEYDPNTYEQLLLTDMTAKTAPDVIAIKQAKYTYQWATGGQLMDLSDVVKGLSKDVTGAASYTVNGKNYGVPYRQDSWLLFYNKALFDQAGVAIPDGTWTWDTYAATAKDLTTKLAAAGSQAKGTYEHSWQSTLQGFANAQAGDNMNPSGPYFSGDYSYMKPYYQRALDLQTAGAQVPLGDITTNKLTYQGQFGKQKTAMMLMGSWYIATLRSQQASGDADAFTWGLAPAPQVDASTLASPVTFGDPTGMGINANLSSDKVPAAKAFMAYIASEAAAKALAGIGITPSTANDAVTAAVFAGAGMPTDALSKKAFQTHTTKPENPSGEFVMQMSTILGAAHTAIMTGSSPVDDALAQAGQKVKDKDW